MVNSNPPTHIKVLTLILLFVPMSLIVYVFNSSAPMFSSGGAFYHEMLYYFGTCALLMAVMAVYDKMKITYSFKIGVLVWFFTYTMMTIWF